MCLFKVMISLALRSSLLKLPKHRRTTQQLLTDLPPLRVLSFVGKQVQWRQMGQQPPTETNRRPYCETGRSWKRRDTWKPQLNNAQRLKTIKFMKQTASQGSTTTTTALQFVRIRRLTLKIFWISVQFFSKRSDDFKISDCLLCLYRLHWFKKSLGSGEN